MGRERLREGFDLVWTDREARGGPVPAPAREVRRTGTERAVQVEAGDRAPRARPLLPELGPRDQHDRPPEALHEPRGDNPDDAAVPVLARDDVAEPPPSRLRPLLH